MSRERHGREGAPAEGVLDGVRALSSGQWGERNRERLTGGARFSGTEPLTFNWPPFASHADHPRTERLVAFFDLSPEEDHLVEEDHASRDPLQLGLDRSKRRREFKQHAMEVVQ